MMVAQHPPDRMVSRPAPGSIPFPSAVPPPLGSSPAVPAPNAFNIIIGGSDPDDPILRLTERDGKLVIEGDESRWHESAMKFLYEMMRWSGQAGIGWKDEVRRAVEGR